MNDAIPSFSSTPLCKEQVILKKDIQKNKSSCNEVRGALSQLLSAIAKGNVTDDESKKDSNVSIDTVVSIKEIDTDASECENDSLNGDVELHDSKISSNEIPELTKLTSLISEGSIKVSRENLEQIITLAVRVDAIEEETVYCTGHCSQRAEK